MANSCGLLKASLLTRNRRSGLPVVLQFLEQSVTGALDLGRNRGGSRKCARDDRLPSRLPRRRIEGHHVHAVRLPPPPLRLHPGIGGCDRVCADPPGADASLRAQAASHRHGAWHRCRRACCSSDWSACFSWRKGRTIIGTATPSSQSSRSLSSSRWCRSSRRSSSCRGARRSVLARCLSSMPKNESSLPRSFTANFWALSLSSSARPSWRGEGGCNVRRHSGARQREVEI